MPEVCPITVKGSVVCPHGGKVVLKSSDPVHSVHDCDDKIVTIADYIGAPISGCSLSRKRGGPCSCVASMNSTECETTHIGSIGFPFALRAAGSITDKGFPLTLVDAGQDIWRIFPHDNGVCQKELLIDSANESKPSRTYKTEGEINILPLRLSYDEKTLRPLRPRRFYDEIDSYYSFRIKPEKIENGVMPCLKTGKIMTYSQSFLYVVSDEETRTYIIRTMGDPFESQFKTVKFCRPLTSDGFSQAFADDDCQTIEDGLDAIPCKPNKSYDFVYSNFALTKEQINDRIKNKINTVKVEIGKDYSQIFEVRDSKKKRTMIVSGESILNTENKINKKEFFERSLSIINGRRLFEASHFSSLRAVVILDDPIGEVLDLREDYRFRYFRHLSQNKQLFDRIKEKNKYAYLVAQTVDNLYMTESETNAFAPDLNELKNRYKALSEWLLKDLSEEKDYAANPEIAKFQAALARNILASINNCIDKDIAERYYAEIMMMNEEFFDDFDSEIIIRDKSSSYIFNSGFTGSLKTGPQAVFRTAFSDLPSRVICFDREADNSNEIARALIVFSICYSDRYKSLRQDSIEARAAAFKSGKLDKSKDDFAKLFRLFHAQLMKIRHYPIARVGSKICEEVKSKLSGQETYRKIISGEDPLISEYENLELSHKRISFNPNDDEPIDFNSLSCGSEDIKREIFKDDAIGTPKQYAKLIGKQLSNKKLASNLKESCNLIESAANDAIKIKLMERLICDIYDLISPIALIDDETDMFSPFIDGAKAVLDAMIFIGKHINYQTASKFQTIHGLKDGSLTIYELYGEALCVLCAHAAKSSDSRFFWEDNFKGNLERFFNETKRDKGTSQEEIKAILEEEDEFYLRLTKNEDREAYVKTIDRLSSAMGIAGNIASVVGTAGDGAIDELRTGGDESRQYAQRLAKIVGVTKIVSFLSVVVSSSDYAFGDKKLKHSDRVALTGSVISFVPDAATAISAAKNAQAGARGAAAFKSLFAFTEGSTRFAGISLVATKIVNILDIVYCAYKINETVDEADWDGNAVVAAMQIGVYSTAAGLSAASVIAFCVGFTPWGIAFLLASLGAKLIWEVSLKRYFTNTPVQSYLENSLFYKESKGIRNYDATILAKTLGKDDMDHWWNTDKLRDCLAKLWDTDSATYDLALQNELDYIHTAIAGLYSIDKTETDRRSIASFKPLHKTGFMRYEFHFKIKHLLNLSPSIFAEKRHIYFSCADRIDYMEIDSDSQEINLIEFLMKLGSENLRLTEPYLRNALPFISEEGKRLLSFDNDNITVPIDSTRAAPSKESRERVYKEIFRPVHFLFDTNCGALKYVVKFGFKTTPDKVVGLRFELNPDEIEIDSIDREMPNKQDREFLEQTKQKEKEGQDND